MKTLLICAALILSACTDPKEATRVLTMNGYTNISYTGYSWFACSKEDFYHTGFTAKLNGNDVEGTVCEGLLFKASTIRF